MTKKRLLSGGLWIGRVRDGLQFDARPSQVLGQFVLGHAGALRLLFLAGGGRCQWSWPIAALGSILRLRPAQPAKAVLDGRKKVCRRRPCGRRIEGRGQRGAGLHRHGDGVHLVYRAVPVRAGQVQAVPEQFGGERVGMLLSQPYDGGYSFGEVPDSLSQPSTSWVSWGGIQGIEVGVRLLWCDGVQCGEIALGHGLQLA